MEGRRKFLLRLHPDLLKELKVWAAHELRSVNAQIEFILREAVRKRRDSKRDAPTEDGDDCPGK